MRYILLVLALVACAREPVVPQPQADLKGSPPADFPDFRPEPDPAAAELLRNGKHDQLAARYEQHGYPTMADLIRAANDVNGGAPDLERAKRVLELKKQWWACSPRTPDQERELMAVAKLLSDGDATAARARGEQAVSQFGAECGLLLETAVATLAQAVEGRATDADFELALRTFVTTDVEIGMPMHSGDRVWPYQLGADAALRRGDRSLALVLANMALLRSHQNTLNPVTEKMLTELVERIRAK